MTDLVRALRHLGSLRAQTRHLSLEQLEQAHSNLAAVVEEDRKRARDAALAKMQRDAVLEKAVRMIHRSGVSLESVLAALEALDLASQAKSAVKALGPDKSVD
ncbi:hypothetical protein TW78_22240 [Vibrio coralliilyticus]|jgi:DNA-binding protein H-NS|nr:MULTISPECIES: hypothetical protein [Vibrio]KJY67758.1 hypothetical protein TW78_22240 [Vibrio coralliilyticus]NOI77460.1 hypothetical protein [Vibrio coralliilyticus]NOJ24229.1 hypothetical protein [Vibrio coralliilyticus]NRF33064.1 hypothetical protein [Vibrio coralliilyticus]NRF55522.1 hypothetical protein [Vibrio coralliilyticus]